MSDHDNKIKTDEQVIVTRESHPSKVYDATAEDTGDPKVSRRRALLAGLAAAPVVLTLMSRSAFATPTNCSVVRSIAAGTSLHTGTTINAGDRTRCAL
jgi:hypothetical protein